MPKFQNIISAFFDTARRQGSKPCAHYKRGGAWNCLTWSQMASSVARLASHLRGVGIVRGDRVAIISNSCLEWTIADCAIIAAGGVTVPVYPSLTPSGIAAILEDSQPKLAFVENEAITAKFHESIKISGLVEIKTVSFEDHGGENLFFGKTSADEESRIREMAGEIALADTATIVYTSGTTGEQKGAILTHGNIFSEVNSARQIFDFGPGEIGLVCLPLAHVLGRLMQFYQLAQGCQAAYAESIEKLAENYREVRPHFVCGVPRMLEKVHEVISLKVDKASNFKKRLFQFSVETGLARSALIGRRRPVSPLLRLKWLFADNLVFRKIRKGLGGRLKCFICGGAALNEDIAKFFHAAGLLVIEGYGLTETFAAATANRFDDYRFGTVGKALPGVELKLADDGEILFRGPTVFKGYLNLPEDTEQAFDSDNWFKTGDIGCFTRDGFLRITGRKKEIIVTATGKNVAPQMIETLMQKLPYISYFMLYGEGRKYLVGLVALNTQAAKEYLRLAGQPLGGGESAAGHPLVRNLIATHIEDINRNLAPFETVKKFAIIEDEFTVAGGEITPTLKIRRAFLSGKYREVLEGLY